MSKFVKQYLSTFAVSISMVCVGFSVSWSSPSLPLLLSKESPIGVTITMGEASWIASLLLFGCVAGNTILGLLLDTFGRRGALLLSSIPIFFSWIMIWLAKSVVILYLARFLLGLAVTVPLAGSVVYIGEISEPSVRGKLGLLNTLMIEVGTTLVITIGSFVSYQTLALASASVPLIFLSLFYWMPESPYYYLRKNDIESAAKCLERLRCKSVNVDKEINDMNINVTNEMKNKSGLWHILTTSKYRKEMIIVLGLKTLHQLSGNIAIQSYMAIIFSQASTGLESNISTIICTVVQIPAMLLASYAVDHAGRKPLYYISTLGCTVALLSEFTYFYLQDTLKQDMLYLSWLPISGIFMFFIFRSLGIITLPYVLLSELFPTNIRGKAAGITLFYSNLLSFLVVLCFPHVTLAWGISVAFLIFAVICFLGFLFVLFYVPETKGKSFSAIQKEIDTKCNVEN